MTPPQASEAAVGGALDVLAIMDSAVSALDGWSAHPKKAAELAQARAALDDLIGCYREMLNVIQRQAELLAAGCKDIPCPRMESRDKYYAVLARGFALQAPTP